MFISILNSSLLYFLFLNITTISVIGYGISISQVSNFKPIFKENIFHYFVMGLILIGSISMLINIFFYLNNYYSMFVIILGTILFIIKYLKIYNNYKVAIKHVLIVSSLSFIFSFYSGFNDDIAYHYNTILNFKNLNLFEIEHSRQISYNSHWLFLKTIFFFTYFDSSIYSLSSILYSLILIDLFANYKKYNDSKYFLISVYSFFCLVFLIGVTNMYKDFGTDMPGVLISIYILLNILYLNISAKKIKIDYIIYIILLLNFIFIIKITNSLVYLFFFTSLFITEFKLRKLINYKILIVFIPVILWFYQNIIISGCIIWPITHLCFYNVGMSNNEMYLIESFAKGDINTKMDVNGFEWISVWLNNHSIKMAETYLLYLILLCFPLIIFKLKNNNFYLKINIDKITLSCFYLIIPCILCNLIWFLYIPAYRFGIFYNLSLIFFLLFPFWISLQKLNLEFFKRSSKILIIIALLFFSYENITKLEWYILKYGENWPPINSGILIRH